MTDSLFEQWSRELVPSRHHKRIPHSSNRQIRPTTGNQSPFLRKPADNSETSVPPPTRRREKNKMLVQFFKRTYVKGSMINANKAPSGSPLPDRSQRQQQLAHEFSLHRPRLWRIVSFRLARRLWGRVDADDILQEAFVDASSRLRHFPEDGSVSWFVWLRQIVQQTLIDVHRRHLHTLKRDVGREVPQSQPRSGGATSVSLAMWLVGNGSTPSENLIRQEMSDQLIEALETMSPIDREILALRHFEELSNNEVAQVLNINSKAASIRYVRALARLKKLLLQLNDQTNQ